MMLNRILKFIIIINLLSMLTGEYVNHEGRPCVNNQNEPQICYPPYDNHASGGRKVIATNTCGLNGRQKYCVGLSTSEMRTRCEYCDDKDVKKRYSADYLTDHNPNNWWQSESLAYNKLILNRESVNLTINLGIMYHVAFIHLQFRNPRPRAMVIYRKYDDNSPWTPWQYFSSNCLSHFNMTASKSYSFKVPDEVLCTEDFSSLNEYYGGIVNFLSLHGRPMAGDFFGNKKMMDWSTASQVRIELRKMHTFGEHNNEEELLLTHFYSISSLQISGRCWCHGHGDQCRRSTGDGLEPQLFCLCHHHTTGQTCNKCDQFYQDKPWKSAHPNNANVCEKCKCNGNSDSCIFNEELYMKSGNVSGGLCLNCKWNTKGSHCEECIDGFYKNPENPTRCIPCNCDAIGRASIQCNNQGICVCQPGIEGNKCTRCKGDHYNFGTKGCQPCNCHLPGVNVTERLLCNPSTGTCYCKKNVIGERCDSCVSGYFSLTESDPLGCRPCFCFAHTKDCTMSREYLLTQIESEFHRHADEWKYGIGSKSPEYSPMLDLNTSPPSITWFIEREPWRDDYFLHAPKKFLGNRRLSYNLNLILELSFGVRSEYQALNPKLISMTNDVLLISETLSVSVPFDVDRNILPDAGNNVTRYIFRLNEESGMWRDRLDHYRFQSILNNLVGIRIRLTNPYGYLRLHKVVMETALDRNLVKFLHLSLPEARSVEKCSCPPQYTGLSCENCAPGYYREYPRGTEFVKCIKCMCNNQSDTCNVRTGACDCQYNTVGHNCQLCAVGFYGDPTSQIRNVCKPCGCPGGTSCELSKVISGEIIVCTDCPDNLGGYRCERCREHYFGNPKLNISCQPCQCHGNLDYTSSCDFITGKCPKCLYDSAGDYCETCKPGFRLLPNEKAPNRCEKCICNSFGSDHEGQICDINSGQCPCKSLVTGLKCDVCKDGYFNLTSTKACEPCNCFGIGSFSDRCDKISGQCLCKPGVTGLRCDHCEFGYFNLSTNGCQRCLCDYEGSTSLQCHLKTGKCSCKPNVISMKCDKCEENYHNLTTSGCEICPPCYGLIQKRVQSLKLNISMLGSSENAIDIFKENSLNETIITVLIQQYNKTLFEIYNSFLKNFDKIVDLENELRNADKTLGNVEIGLFNPKLRQMMAKIKIYVQEINTFEKNANKLLEQDFIKKLNELKNYIKHKNENNENVTKTAEIANKFFLKVLKQRELLDKALSQSKLHLNDSSISFLELYEKYERYLNDSSQFNVKELKELGLSVQSDSLLNLRNISRFNKTLTEMENQLNDGKTKLQVILNETSELLISFGDSESLTNNLNEQFSKFLLMQTEMAQLEEEVNSKTIILTRKTVAFTEALDIMAKLKEAQNNITNAISKANRTITKLEDLYKDFNEVVNKSRLEAEEQMKRMPYLNVKLVEIEIEIQKLNESSIDIISKMIAIRNNLHAIYNDSVKLEENLLATIDQITKLLNESGEELKVTNKTENKLNDKLRESELLEGTLLKMSEQLERSRNTNNLQIESGNQLEIMFSNIMNEILRSANQSKLSNEQFSEKVQKLSIIVDNFFQKEFAMIFTNMNNVDKDWLELNNELELTDKEIHRLKLIDEHMVSVDQNVCFRSGGKTEGM